MSRAVPTSTDVFVIGGGPAGLGAAITARQRGFRVVVADGSRPPIDKACGEGFLPDGLEALEHLGIHVPMDEAFPFRGVRFLSASLSAEAQFPEGDTGLAVRRTVFIARWWNARRSLAPNYSGKLRSPEFLLRACIW